MEWALKCGRVAGVIFLCDVRGHVVTVMCLVAGLLQHGLPLMILVVFREVMMLVLNVVVIIYRAVVVGELFIAVVTLVVELLVIFLVVTFFGWLCCSFLFLLDAVWLIVLVAMFVVMVGSLIVLLVLFRSGCGPSFWLLGLPKRARAPAQSEQRSARYTRKRFYG